MVTRVPDAPDILRGIWSDPEPVAAVPRRPVTFDDLRIRSRSPGHVGQLVPFRLNDFQRRFLDMLQDRYGTPRGVDLWAEPWRLQGARVMVLKARQLGASSLIDALCYLAWANLDYIQCVIATHRTESTVALWERIRTFHRELPDRKPTEYRNRRELVAQGTESRIFIGTAGQDDLARSATLTHIHLSETAMWPAGTDELLTGLLGAVGEEGNLFDESTARGYGSHYDRWHMYEEDERPGVVAFFAPWYWSPEYSRKVDRELTDEDRAAAGQSVYGLTDEQVCWYADKLAEFRRLGRAHEMAQEFPSDPEQAFLARVTNAYFDVRYLTRIRSELVDAAPFEVVERGQRGLGGQLRIWSPPEPGATYVVGVDPSQGIDDDDDHDFHAVDVVRLSDGKRIAEHVASYESRCDMERAAGDVAAIAAHYNDARVIVLRAGPGLAMLLALSKDHAGLKLYTHKVQRVVAGRAVESTELGFPESVQTKALLDEELRDAVARNAEGNDVLLLRDLKTVDEMIRYVELPGGKRGAITGHDDHVSALKAAWWLAQRATPDKAWEALPKRGGGFYGRRR